MILSNIERLIRFFPFIRRYYLKHYGDIRFILFKVSKILPILKFPRYIHLLVTFDCNLSCRQCQVDANRRKVNTLTSQEIIHVIKEIEEAGIRHLVITGGEPLIRKDIFDILRYAGNLEFLSSLNPSFQIVLKLFSLIFP